MNIIIKKNYVFFKDYKLKCSVGKLGIKKFKKEGDLTTPKGLFKLGILYFRGDRNKNLKALISKKKIKKNMGWCDDINSKRYNQEIRFPYKYHAERLYRRDGIYDIFINIKYNQNPTIKGKGSAIFLHLANKNYKTTKGCVAISKKDFLKILPYIKKKNKNSYRLNVSFTKNSCA